jgi:hypothetical protein
MKQDRKRELLFMVLLSSGDAAWSALLIESKKLALRPRLTKTFRRQRGFQQIYPRVEQQFARKYLISG